MRKLIRLPLFVLSVISAALAWFLAKLARLKSYLAEKISRRETPEIAVKGSSETIGTAFAIEQETFQRVTENDVLTAFEKYGSKDPFPEIAPALLNSRDISAYVHATGMLYPFSPAKLKSASYEIAMLGKCVFWDEDGQKHVRVIEKGDEFVLRRNSIAFVTLEPTFRIPDYIALRFNLKITHIYRGILLGTGPLVDPGFSGRLSVPLHNLTNNDYTITGGDDLIWMEFTKVSKYKQWDTTAPQQGSDIYQYHPFPKSKNLPDVEFYLRKADAHRSIRSSIPEVSKEALQAKNFLKFFTTISVVALLAFGTGLLNYFSSNESYLRDSQEKLHTVRTQLDDEKYRLQQMQITLDELRSRVQALEAKNK